MLVDWSDHGLFAQLGPGIDPCSFVRFDLYIHRKTESTGGTSAAAQDR
jgi:hypothetical protein